MANIYPELPEPSEDDKVFYDKIRNAYNEGYFDEFDNEEEELEDEQFYTYEHDIDTTYHSLRYDTGRFLTMLENIKDSKYAEKLDVEHKISVLKDIYNMLNSDWNEF